MMGAAPAEGPDVETSDARLRREGRVWLLP